MHFTKFKWWGRLLFILSFISSFDIKAQNPVNKNEMTVKMPFDSLSVISVSAKGVKSSKLVEVKVRIKSLYAKTVNLHFALGDYSEFGIIDDKKRKYKIFTNDQSVGTQGINENYFPLSIIQFGDSRYHGYSYLEQDLKQGTHKDLEIRFTARSNDIDNLNFHIRCIPSVNYSQVGDGLLEVSNSMIDWQK